MFNQFLVQKRLVMPISAHSLLVTRNTNINKHILQSQSGTKWAMCQSTFWSIALFQQSSAGLPEKSSSIVMLLQIQRTDTTPLYYRAGNEMVRTVHGAKQECNPRIHSRQSEERQQSSTILTFSFGLRHQKTLLEPGLEQDPDCVANSCNIPQIDQLC
jgi:hypothetical protein